MRIRPMTLEMSHLVHPSGICVIISNFILYNVSIRFHQFNRALRCLAASFNSYPWLQITLLVKLFVRPSIQLILINSFLFPSQIPLTKTVLLLLLFPPLLRLHHLLHRFPSNRSSTPPSSWSTPPR